VNLGYAFSFGERVMGFEPTISCLGSKRSTTELHPHGVSDYTATQHAAGAVVRAMGKWFADRPLPRSERLGLSGQELPCEFDKRSTCIALGLERA
jgi:hypothetical protein